MHRHVTVVLLAGVVGAARTHAVTGNTGTLSGCQATGTGSIGEAGAAGVGGAHRTEEPG